ncbi:MAG: hypothetical protein JXR76_24385 [Deltaproteobacteria bacterium]|nr:hypothetical protein [Deltaproteobacteria bacterium]
MSVLSDLQGQIQKKLKHDDVFVQLQNGKAIIVVLQNSRFNDAGNDARKKAADETRDVIADAIKDKNKIENIAIFFEKFERKYVLFTFQQRLAPFVYKR